MDLQELALFYEQFLYHQYVLVVGKRNKQFTFKLSFRGDHFHHLLGLQKLVDLPELQPRNKYAFFENVKTGKFQPDITKSIYYTDIADRPNIFYRIENLLQQNIIIRFNKNRAYTSIHAQALLYEKYQNHYIHLFFTLKNQLYHPCSFFAHHDTKYIANQEVFNILDLKMIT